MCCIQICLFPCGHPGERFVVICEQLAEYNAYLATIGGDGWISSSSSIAPASFSTSLEKTEHLASTTRSFSAHQASQSSAEAISSNPTARKPPPCFQVPPDELPLADSTRIGKYCDRCRVIAVANRDAPAPDGGETLSTFDYPNATRLSTVQNQGNTNLSHFLAVLMSKNPQKPAADTAEQFKPPNSAALTNTDPSLADSSKALTICSECGMVTDPTDSVQHECETEQLAHCENCNMELNLVEASQHRCETNQFIRCSACGREVSMEDASQHVCEQT